jgi:hypothetical protein
MAQSTPRWRARCQRGVRVFRDPEISRAFYPRFTETTARVPPIPYYVLKDDFHISEISTSKNCCGVLDVLSAQSYNRCAKAFQSFESLRARQAQA